MLLVIAQACIYAGIIYCWDALTWAGYVLCFPAAWLMACCQDFSGTDDHWIGDRQHYVCRVRNRPELLDEGTTEI